MIVASRFEKRMKELREANWWIRAPLRKDGDVSPDKDYVPDIFVHMPHLRFGKGSIYCPRCERADRVTPKQIPTHKCPIRRVCGMEHFYGVLECRYTCGHCHDAYTAAKEEARAQSGGGAVQRADIDAEPFTFMPHADFTLAMLEYNQGYQFPALLSERGGIDKLLMDYNIMRPLVDSGTAPEAYGDAVMEVHMKRWKGRMLIHESEQRAYQVTA